MTTVLLVLALLFVLTGVVGTVVMACRGCLVSQVNLYFNGPAMLELAAGLFAALSSNRE